ncbi:GntR family transcriptional regulator [Bifidobacterium phasiani]|uniref:GntR family transcriptional regulator n=1 Tax=Bifidobacterium phasiani TaxID=2834431 RepID=A0ABS6W8R8_9BIFI|nr:GntR family transcriptional regulator [Bifidobacterium phasiani]MBW3082484.1 GntR family transcriptional regulator [Bifidobacterium phasiani]
MPGYTRTEQLEQEIIARIADGTFKPGDKLMSESELSERYQVSRGTVRRALEGLKRRRLIETRAGAGSYVAFHGRDLEGADGWTTASVRSGVPTTTRLLSCDLVDRPDALADEPQAADMFYRIVRCRLFRSMPISHETSYLPATRAMREVMEHGLVRGSVSGTMRAAGMTPAGGVVDIAAEALGEAAGAALGKPAETVFLLSERRSYAADGSLVEYVRSYLDPSHFTMHIAIGGQ